MGVAEESGEIRGLGAEEDRIRSEEKQRSYPEHPSGQRQTPGEV